MSNPRKFNFHSVFNIEIPEGVVQKITRAGITLWQKLIRIETFVRKTIFKQHSLSKLTKGTILKLDYFFKSFKQLNITALTNFFNSTHLLSHRSFKFKSGTLLKLARDKITTIKILFKNNVFAVIDTLSLANILKHDTIVKLFFKTALKTISTGVVVIKKFLSNKCIQCVRIMKAKKLLPEIRFKFLSSIKNVFVGDAKSFYLSQNTNVLFRIQLIRNNYKSMMKTLTARLESLVHLYSGHVKRFFVSKDLFGHLKLETTLVSTSTRFKVDNIVTNVSKTIRLARISTKHVVDKILTTLKSHADITLGKISEIRLRAAFRYSDALHLVVGKLSRVHTRSPLRYFYLQGLSINSVEKFKQINKLFKQSVASLLKKATRANKKLSAKLYIILYNCVIKITNNRIFRNVYEKTLYGTKYVTKLYGDVFGAGCKNRNLIQYIKNIFLQKTSGSNNTLTNKVCTKNMSKITMHFWFGPTKIGTNLYVKQALTVDKVSNNIHIY